MMDFVIMAVRIRDLPLSGTIDLLCYKRSVRRATQAQGRNAITCPSPSCEISWDTTDIEDFVQPPL